MQHYEVKAHSAAKAATIYALLLDGKSWPAWMGVDSVEVEAHGQAPGKPSAPGQTGEIRLIRTGRYSNREQIVELVPGQRFSYIILDSMLHDYKGDVELSSSPSRGTDIRWSGRFRMSFPFADWLMQLYLTRFMQHAVTKLAHYAEQSESTPTL